MTRVNGTEKGTLAKRFVMTLAATAVAFGAMTAGATPARANDASDDLAKLLAGIAAVVIIGKAIQDNRRHDDVAPPTPNPPVDWPRPHDKRGKWLPQVCAFEVDGLRHDRIVYSGRCLRHEGFDAPLPRECARKVRIHGDNDRFFSARCLEDAGFRTGRRHHDN
ncbi:MAG: hypothetical protein WCC57_10245 [Paracoccaceae bacterium]